MKEQTVTIPISLMINLLADYSHAIGYIDGIKPDSNHFYRDSLDNAMEGFNKAMKSEQEGE